MIKSYRFFDPWNSETCQYAWTRESLATDSPNHGVNWCSYYTDVNGVDMDLHGAHMIATKGKVKNRPKPYSLVSDLLVFFVPNLSIIRFLTLSGFKNFHMSHVEVFNAGQPRLARYPIHWHHADYVGEKGGYQDPSFVDSLSIHDSFSRFVTVHGTHEAGVYNCVG